MSWSIKIGRVAGTDVKIHVTFLLLLIWVAMVYYSEGGINAAIDGVVFVLALFGCVLLHEFGHALMARAFGIPTPDITLLPIGGVARLQRMPDKPVQEILVALAGPAVNVVIAVVLFVWLGAWRDLAEIEHLPRPRLDMVPKLAVVNVWLVLFNMLPAFPMDGGRVLRAVLALFTSYATATQIAARIGQFMAFLFGLAGLLGNPMLLFIALFIYLAAAQEASYAQMKEIAQGLVVRDAMLTRFTVLDARATLQDVINVLLQSGQHEFPVIDERGTVVGMLTRDEVIAGYRNHGPDMPVSEVMHRNVPTIHVNAPLERALQQMQECACPALAAVDRYGRVVGLVSPERIGEMMMIHAVLPRGANISWHKAGA
ncbi:MAG: site-2 protease family protein [Gemmataceae bacterium]|nr:site-2 protease family protein [Gemmataceae bacterium]MDW8267168.1 site-2 protease family protein [Gemmataceae bacterium]